MIDEDKLLIRALNISYYFLKARPRTIHEVKERLKLRATQKPKRYPFTETIIEKAIAQLMQEQFLDDKKFVEWSVRYRTVMEPKGAYVLKQELKKFGAPQDIVDAYFEENQVDEVPLATELLKKRINRYSREVPQKRYKKMSDFLARRGFGYGTIKTAIQNLDK